MKECDYKNPKEALKNFLAYKSTSVGSLKLLDIERDIGKFLKPIQDMRKFEEMDIVKHLEALKKYSISHRNGIKAYIKQFVKWNYPNWSYDFRNLDKICKTEKLPKTYQAEEMLSKEDIEKLVKGENSPFWKAYFLTFFYGGFRPSEACCLKWENIELTDEGAFISITATKNKKDFVKFVPSNVSFYLNKLKEESKSKFVFPSPFKTKEHISAKGVYFRLKELSKKALKRQINPYLLRHSVATLLYNRQDVKDEDVALQLGHTKNMRATYDNANLEMLKTKARKMWIETEDLPKKQKAKYEERLAELERSIGILQKQVTQWEQQELEENGAFLEK